MSKTKIAISGIGAVGGYYGGLLAARYKDSEDIDIYFISRGENLKEIRENGIEVKNTFLTIKAKPTLATDNPVLLYQKLRFGREYSPANPGDRSEHGYHSLTERGKHNGTHTTAITEQRDLERMRLHRFPPGQTGKSGKVHHKRPDVLR